MRAVEQDTLRVPGRNAQRLSRWALWLLTPLCLAVTAGLIYAYASHWTWPRELLCGTLALADGCLMLSLWSQERFWWAPRVLAGLVTLACVAAFYRLLLFPLAGAAPRVPALFLATVAFMIWGLPCLCFLLWGHTGGKLARRDVLHATPMDRFTAQLMPALAWATGLALGVYLLRLLLP